MAYNGSIVRFRTGYDPNFWATIEVKPYGYGTDRLRFYSHAEPNESASRQLDIKLTGRLEHQTGTVWVGGLNDPYPPVEKQNRVTRLTYEVIAKYQLGLLLFTRNPLLLRDIDLLEEINQTGGATVAVPIPTLTKTKLRRMEAGSIPLHDRIELLSRVYASGLHAGIFLPVIIPEVNGTVKELKALFRFASENACRFLLLPDRSPAFRKQYGKILVELSAEYKVPLRLRRQLPKDFRRENYRLAAWIANNAYYRMLAGKPYKDLHSLARFINRLPVDVRNLVKNVETRRESGMTEEWFELMNSYYLANHDTRLPQTT